jgi:beta-lactamase regulating signal transducer with metallopeptidase domain
MLLFLVMPVVTVWELHAPYPPAAAPGAGRSAPAWEIAQVVAGAGASWRGIVNEWAVTAWACGVLLFSLRLAWGAGRISAMRRTAVPAAPALQTTVAALAERIGVRRVGVLTSRMVGVPGTIGWIRPVILVPAAALAGLTPQQLQAVLAHELAHIRRHDYLANLLQMVVETLLFYHPAVWWVSGRVRHERELCCDDLAVRSCGDALGYARALAALEKARLPLPSPAMASAGGPLLHRIERLFRQEVRTQGASRLAAAAALLTLGILCLLLNLGWARSQPAAGGEQAGNRQETPAPAQQTPLPSNAPRPVLPAAPPAPGQVPGPTGPPAPPQPESDMEILALVGGQGFDGLVFQVDGKRYVVRDPEILRRIAALLKQDSLYARTESQYRKLIEAAGEPFNEGVEQEFAAQMAKLQESLALQEEKFKALQASQRDEQFKEFSKALQVEETKLRLQLAALEEMLAEIQSQLGALPQLKDLGRNPAIEAIFELLKEAERRGTVKPFQ